MNKEISFQHEKDESSDKVGVFFLFYFRELWTHLTDSKWVKRWGDEFLGEKKKTTWWWWCF